MNNFVTVQQPNTNIRLKAEKAISKDYVKTASAPSVHKALGTFLRCSLVKYTIKQQVPTMQRINILEFPMGSMCTADIFSLWVQKDLQAKVSKPLMR